jgi:hypothetical protein
MRDRQQGEDKTDQYALPGTGRAAISQPSPENPLWQQHLERLRQVQRPTPPGARPAVRRPTPGGLGQAEEARRGEWTAVPLSKLGHRLLADVEPYLAFFAIARAD